MELNFPDILQDFCDIHLHVGPSLIPRYCDIAEMAVLAKDAGYRAIVMKDHHCLSAPVAQLVKKHFMSDCEMDVFGSFCMNNATGGLNPSTVESAICWGAKIIWLPTVSAAKHIQLFGSEGKGGFPGTSVVLHESPLTLTDEAGVLKPEVVDCLKLIAQSPQVVLATGHASAAEINAVVEKSAELGIKRLVVDHPSFCVEASIEQTKYWASLGAWIEHAGTISDPRSNELTQPEADIAVWIKEIGVEHTLLSSDYGQTRFGNPVEGMDRYLTELHKAGVSREDLKTMCCVNTAKLLY